MNCSQCESRIQYLLDSRVDPRDDGAIQDHVRCCQECRTALSIFAAFLAVTPAMDVFLPAPSPAFASSPNSQTRKSFKKRAYRFSDVVQVLVATAALVAIGLIPWWNPPVRMQPVALNSSTPANTTTVATTAKSASEIRRISWLPTSLPRVPAIAVRIGDWREFDLVSLMPDESVQTVRGIPATIESIEPWYRYSVELPVFNKWSGGINYTIGVIRNHLPGIAPLHDDSPGGFGMDSLLHLRNIA